MTAATATVHVPQLEGSIVGHRGLPSRTPENTLASFNAALDAGARWIETDVDILADGTPIVIHDTTLDRTTDHSGQIYSLTKPDLAAIDAGSWFGPQFTDERIPLLSQLITLANQRSLNLNLELKANEQGAERTLQQIDSVIEALEDLDGEREVIISSFSQPLLARFHQRAPQYAVGVLYEGGAVRADWLSVLELCGASYIHPEHVDLTPERVKMLRQAGYGVNVWTVNPVDKVNEFLNWGCTAVMTDVADRVLRG